MKSRLAQWIIFAALGAALEAAEMPVVGGMSQDRHFEIVLVETEEMPVLRIRDMMTGAVIAERDGGGYCHGLQAAAEKFNTTCVWGPNNNQVLVKRRGTKWSTDVLLLQFAHGEFSDVALPDLYPMVLKDIGVPSIYRRAFVAPVRWENATSIVLKIEGDCDLPGLKPEESRRWFEYEATLDLTGNKPPVIKRLSLKDNNG